jgi:V/A-type H+-transporting ATPase subunit E
MKYDHLIQSMEKDAGEKIQAILQRADKEGKGEWDLAHEKAEDYRVQLLNGTRTQIELERTRQIYLVREELRVQLVKEQEKSIEEVFSEAEHKLASVRTDPSYETCFSALLAEVLEGMGDRETELHVDPRDEDLCRSLLQKTGRQCIVIPDITSAGGLYGSSPDGRLIVRNTMEDRFIRARGCMKAAVFTLLSRDPDVR